MSVCRWFITQKFNWWIQLWKGDSRQKKSILKRFIRLVILMYESFSCFSQSILLFFLCNASTTEQIYCKKQEKDWYIPGLMFFMRYLSIEYSFLMDCLIDLPIVHFKTSACLQRLHAQVCQQLQSICSSSETRPETGGVWVSLQLYGIMCVKAGFS